ncbi:MAG: glycosyltransferase, partial [Bacteroidales bacterium]|nr:glycosyltransferase [Bacteroidales bacterium]
MIDISIILVTFNHQQEIQTCLKSLRAALTSYHAQIIFIDNYSSDRTVPNARVELEQFEPQHKWLI